MTTRHKYYEEIIAYANGAIIQLLNTNTQTWLDNPNPAFYECVSYRIKPEPKQLWVRPYLSKASTAILTYDSPFVSDLNSSRFNWVGPAVLVWEES